MMRRQWNAAVTAVQFLTRVPIPGGMNRPNPDLTLLKASVVYFPLVGGLIGLATGSVLWVGLQVWPAIVAVVLALIFEALLTGAFHEDAVADCCDAFGGGWTREDVLRIMKDSRVGSYGSLGLLLAVALRAAGLFNLKPEYLIAATAGSAALGRWAILILMCAVPPIPNREGLSKDVGEQTGLRELLISSGIVLPFTVGLAWLLPGQLAIGCLLMVLLVLVWGWYVKRRIGGITGDCLGCGCYMAQCVILAAAVLHR
jgi:adenosylcobinamide-GDP ribazoletransferase